MIDLFSIISILGVLSFGLFYIWSTITTIISLKRTIKKYLKDKHSGKNFSFKQYIPTNPYTQTGLFFGILLNLIILLTFGACKLFDLIYHL